MKILILIIIINSTDNSSERIIGVLAIGFVTLLCLLILTLSKAHKLKTKIKELEK